MKNYILVAFTILFCSCKQDSAPLDVLFAMPKKLKEVSGIVYEEKSEMFWTLEDSGNSNKIYGLNAKNGTVEKTITIQNTSNIDWEDITKDKQGNLYIGDFGNNNNDRKDLCIYKIDKKDLDQGNVDPTYKVLFSYPEQTAFPPEKTKLFYDVEGFFEFKNNFYLFTKNRSVGFDGSAMLYKIPNTAGSHQAILMGKFNTCDHFDHCAITSAAISPDESKVVLLSHDKIWLFENFKADDFLKGTQIQLHLNHFSQKEAICFKDDSTLIIADEKTKKIGGKVYEVNFNKTKIQILIKKIFG